MHNLSVGDVAPVLTIRSAKHGVSIYSLLLCNVNLIFKNIYMNFAPVECSDELASIKDKHYLFGECVRRQIGKLARKLNN